MTTILQPKVLTEAELAAAEEPFLPADLLAEFALQVSEEVDFRP